MKIILTSVLLLSIFFTHALVIENNIPGGFYCEVTSTRQTLFDGTLLNAKLELPLKDRYCSVLIASAAGVGIKPVVHNYYGASIDFEYVLNHYGKVMVRFSNLLSTSNMSIMMEGESLGIAFFE
jgi:hypothetical protein